MGTSWTLRCIEHGVDAEIDDHAHGTIFVDEVRPIARRALTLALLSANDDFEIRTASGVEVPLRWLREHAGCTIRPVSEYGQLDGTCGKGYLCSHCNLGLGYCSKDLGHEGECGEKE